MGGNVLNACTLEYADDHLTGLKAMACSEKKFLKNKIEKIPYEEGVKTCTDKYDISYEDVKECADGEEGNNLSYLAYLSTPKELTYVPWVLVNGVHANKKDEDQIIDNVMDWVCRNYQGDQKETVCNQNNKIKNNSNNLINNSNNNNNN